MRNFEFGNLLEEAGEICILRSAIIRNFTKFRVGDQMTEHDMVWACRFYHAWQSSMQILAGYFERKRPL